MEVSHCRQIPFFLFETIFYNTV